MAKSEPKPFTQADAVRILQDVAVAFLNPAAFKPGDLVQTRSHFESWEGADQSKKAPVMVLAIYDDLGTVTEQPEDIGVKGIRVARLYPDEEGVAMLLEHAWHFEPYTGPMPDAH
jgi:hypothetical protein